MAWHRCFSSHSPFHAYTSTSKALPSISSSASPWSYVGSGLLPAGAAHLWLQFCLRPPHSGAGEEVKSRLHILPIVRRGHQEHYAHTTLLHSSPVLAPTSPGSGRVEGKPARKPWVGAGTARSVDDVPCVTIQMLSFAVQHEQLQPEGLIHCF